MSDDDAPRIWRIYATVEQADGTEQELCTIEYVVAADDVYTVLPSGGEA